MDAIFQRTWQIQQNPPKGSLTAQQKLNWPSRSQSSPTRITFVFAAAESLEHANEKPFILQRIKKEKILCVCFFKFRRPFVLLATETSFHQLLVMTFVRCVFVFNGVWGMAWLYGCHLKSRKTVILIAGFGCGNIFFMQNERRKYGNMVVHFFFLWKFEFANLYTLSAKKNLFFVRKI